MKRRRVRRQRNLKEEKEATLQRRFPIIFRERETSLMKEAGQGKETKKGEGEGEDYRERICKRKILSYQGEKEMPEILVRG